MYHSEVKRKAKDKLKGNWGSAILVGVICSIASRLSFQHYNSYTHHNSITIISIAISLLLSPIVYGVFKYFMGFIRDERVTIGEIFNSYKDFSRIVVATFLQWLFIMLWSLLLIVPGIIKIFSYSMMYNIMSDNPEMSGSEALELSKEMMNGHKMDLFILYMSTVGWVSITLAVLLMIAFVGYIVILFGGTSLMLAILVIVVVLIIILSILMLWLQPLYLVAKSYFYEEVRREYMYNREVC
jgi:Predicted integral membrane protein